MSDHHYHKHLTFACEINRQHLFKQIAVCYRVSFTFQVSLTNKNLFKTLNTVTDILGDRIIFLETII